jgi:hypothetical protein
MNDNGKLISFIDSRVGYWLRAAAMATAPSGAGPLAAWVVSLLEIRPSDRILELGCGPDMLMKSILKAHKNVLVAAVDPSFPLVEDAWRRNARAVKHGRAMLINTSIDHGLPAFVVPFTKVVGVNPQVFAARPLESLKAVRTVMAPCGKIVLAVQPAGSDATVADARGLAKELCHHLAAAGFAALSLSEKGLQPAPAVCVTGLNPGNAPATTNANKQK